MSSQPIADQPGGASPGDAAGAVPQRLPPAAWALAWTCLAGQLLLLADVGTSPLGIGTVPSMLLSALVVWWFSNGVLTGRTVRLVIVWVLFVVVVVADVFAVADSGLGRRGAHLVASVAQVAALAWFSSTPYFRWQRSRPQVPGPSLAPVLGVAVVVGLLGGITAQVADQASVRIHLG